MPVCTFFGHREFPESVTPVLYAVLEDLIQNQGVTMFYVGNQGKFDSRVRSCLRTLTARYPQASYAVVLAYMPGRNLPAGDPDDTMLPEGIEKVYPRYAISWRNRWMLERADYVVTHITHSWGGAASFAHQARKQGKTVINLDGSSFDSLSANVLEAILRNEANGLYPLPTETVFEICGILAKRNPSLTKEQAAASWERFQQHYLDDIPE